MNTKKEYDLLIVGAGIYGATAAYKAKQEGKRCLVIDIRPHLVPFVMITMGTHFYYNKILFK